MALQLPPRMRLSRLGWRARNWWMNGSSLAASRESGPSKSIKRVELAEQARQNWDASLKAGLELSSELTRGISPKDLETTRTVLRTMLERL